MDGRRFHAEVANPGRSSSRQIQEPSVTVSPTRLSDTAQPLSSQVVAAVSALFDVVHEPLAMLSADGSVLLANHLLLSFVGAPSTQGTIVSWQSFRSHLFNAFGTHEVWERLESQLHQAYGRQTFRAAQRWPEVREVVIDATPSVLGAHFGGLAISFQDTGALRSVDHFSTEVLEALGVALSSPLTTLVGFAELLLQDGQVPLTPEQYEYLSVIRDNAKLEASLVAELLELGRLRMGRVDLHVSQVEVPWLVAMSVGDVEHNLQVPLGNTVVIDLPERLPQVVVDPELARSVLASLVLRAQRRNPPDRSVHITGNVSHRFVNVEVQDFGTRLSPAQQGRLMQLPYTLPQSPDIAEYQEGLMLAKAQAMTALLGGELRVTTGFNAGSVLSVGLPIDH